MPSIRSKCGLSLAEVLLALALASVLTLLLIALSLTAMKGNQKASDLALTQSLAHQELDREIYQAQQDATADFWTGTNDSIPLSTRNLASGRETYTLALYVSDLNDSTTPGLKRARLRLSWWGGEAARGAMVSSSRKWCALLPAPEAARRPSRAFSLPELMLSMAVFSVLTLISSMALRMVSKVWQRASARDLALRELLKASAWLERDLVNGFRAPQQSSFGPVQSGSGATRSGDALALIVPAHDQDSLRLTPDGVAQADQLVTYYLTVPTAQASGPFAGDAEGYEEQCPWKWLVRCQEAAPAPGAPGQTPAIPAGWLASTVIQQPTTLWKTNDRQVVALQLLQFRVQQGPPLWQLSLTAVAIGDARRQLALGSVPLGGSRFTLTHQVAVQVRN